MEIQKHNIKDLIIGIAIGDAFGAGVEFQDKDWIRRNIDFTAFVNARNNISVPKDQLTAFTQNYTPWDYTDDTEMTLGLMKALMTNEPFSKELLIQKWKTEYDRGNSKKGHGRNGHGSMSWYYSGEKTIEEIRAFQRTRKNPGNAPAMRSVPLGLIPSHLINNYAEINAQATHPNIHAILSSQCIAKATEFLLMKGGDPKDIISYCQSAIELDKDYQKYLTEVDQLPDYEDLAASNFETLCGPQPIQEPYFLPGIKGVPSDSKYTAGSVLYVLKNSRNAMEALRNSIYLGGDVDSVASICTGILAAKTGLSSLPNFMENHVEGISYLTEIANQFWEWLSI